jgi:uracil-DNA glycosylase
MDIENTASESSRVQLESGWKLALEAEFSKPYMAHLRKFLADEVKKGRVIYPRPGEFFAALNSTPFSKVKVVILGQDPYHGPGQAHGLSFSVRPGVRPPPSLANIFKELKTDLGMARPDHGYLQSWADEGVLLLNATLSVQEGQAGSHQKKGWEAFTDQAIQQLNTQRENLVFILWGSYAQKKGAWIDRRRHLVIESPHPSPLSSHRGFFGSRPFSQANEYLVSKGLSPINWSLPKKSQIEGLE